MKDENSCKGVAFEILKSHALSTEDLETIIGIIAEIIACDTLSKERNGENE